MRKILTAFTFLFSFMISSHAQTMFIPLAVDHSFFRGGDDQIYMEIYLSFYQNYLQYSETDSGFTAGYFAITEIVQNDSILYQDYERKTSVIDSLEQISNYRKFLSIFTFLLDEGDYSATIKLKDLNSGREGEYYFDFKTPEFSSENLAIGSIQLCSTIRPDTSKGEFQKNSYLTIPNPDNLYSISQPVLYYYTEIYNLSYTPQKAGQYSLNCTITDLEGNEIKKYPEKLNTKPGVSAVIVGGHNIVTLPSSTYIFNMEAKDLETNETVVSSKRFTFFKPSDKKIAESDTSTISEAEYINLAYYVQFSEKQLDAEFEKIGYMTTNVHRKIFYNLDVQSKRIFLAKFWKSLDKTPDTEVNEFREYYFSLVDFADANFGSMTKEGWTTDRGRILLTYGKPNEIDRYYMEIDKKPHEIWHYHELEGGSIFVFADITGFGEFDLIHSTYSRELSQPDWQRLVQKAQTSSGFDDFNN